QSGCPGSNIWPPGCSTPAAPAGTVRTRRPKRPGPSSTGESRSTGGRRSAFGLRAPAPGSRLDRWAPPARRRAAAYSPPAAAKRGGGTRAAPGFPSLVDRARLGLPERASESKAGRRWPGRRRQQGFLQHFLDVLDHHELHRLLDLVRYLVQVFAVLL